MSTPALGSLSFLDTPDVNGNLVLTTATGLTAAQLLPTAGATTITTSGSNLIFDVADNMVMGGTAGFTMPTGTTAQRPTTPVTGVLRFNTTIGLPEFYSSGWLPVGKVIQSQSGQIANNAVSIAGKASATAIPTTAETTAMWSTTFTPLSPNSVIVIQYTITAYAATASRVLLATAFVGTVCVDTVGCWVAVAATTAGAGVVNMALNAVYQNTGTTALTISGRLGHYANASTTAVSIGWNSFSGNTATFGGTTPTEWRILEILP